MTEMLTDEKTFESIEEESKKDNRAHIVNPPANTHIWRPGMTAQDIVDIARVNRIEIVALCGYKFVPQHDPDKLDACQVCFDVAGMLMRNNGE